MIDVRPALLVAGRELRAHLRGRALWFSLAISVIAVSLLIVLPKLVGGGPTTYRVAVAGQPDAAVRSALVAAAEATGATAQIRTVADRAAAEQALRADGPQYADIAVLDAGRGPVLVERAFPAGSTDQLPRTAQAIAYNLAVVQAVRASGLPPGQAEQLISPRPLAIEHLRPEPGSQAARFTAFAGSILFFVLAMRYGFALLSSVTQEKATRVVEVLLASVRPVDLLAGKVAAVTLLVTAEAAVLVGTALISAAAVGSDVLHGGGAGLIVVEGIWIVLGFLLYAALFAAAGAMAVRPEDAQSVGLPLQIPLFVGYFASTTALGGGTPSGLITVLGYVPFTAPMNMPMLVAAGSAGPVQIAISMLVAAVTAVSATWAAAAIFRASILRTGQRVRLKALLRERRRGAALARP